MFWSDLAAFERDAGSADEATLRAMRDWAAGRESRADRPGRGRNPKARRLFRQMRQAAEQELDRRGLLWS